MNTTDTFTPPREVDSLWYGCEDSASRDYDWSKGYGETFTAYEPLEGAECTGEAECQACDDGEVDQHDEAGSTVPCDECNGTGKVPCDWTGTAVARSGCWACPQCDEEHETDGAEGPMMNYYYPLPSHGSFSESDAAKLEGLPLCLVNFHEQYGDHYEGDSDLPEWALALTGGGMDLSWQIAEAHMRLGYMPPLFTCNLPRMAGMDYTSPLNAWIIAGCKRSAEAVRNNGQSMMDRLDELTGVE